MVKRVQISGRMMLIGLMLVAGEMTQLGLKSIMTN